jgi:hypothetical protein
MILFINLCNYTNFCLLLHLFKTKLCFFILTINFITKLNNNFLLMQNEENEIK